ncbi:hypothetical protein [Pedobacter hartonius]|uniref:Uncharacterized protein n=1 Tax=Pedobacter hartonius TaxID=425514 RepID=A0A1H4DWR5_9SPHI|nr:hypothetical protein [Pedobacter hartonius]SEA77191.1 hypothetical protein SAMN05443550_105139 [Pedobacter hartonius]
MNSIPDELTDLLHYCHSLAKLLLEEQGEFYPFGVYLNPGNVITQRMFHDGDDFPLSTGLINIIKYDFDHQLAAGSILGAAITYEAKITNEQYRKSVQVIAVRLSNSRLQPGMFCYLPYRITDNKIEYLPSWTEIE